MGGIGPCDSIKIIFGYHVNSSMCSKPQFTNWTFMGGTGPCGPMTIIVGSVIKSQYASLNIKFGVNRTFPSLPI